MGSADYLALGKWNVICDRCGVKRKNDQVRKEWTGLIVCIDKCWEERHPQDFVRSKPDDTSVPFTRPEKTDIFVDVTYSCSGEDEVYITQQHITAVGSGNLYIGKGRSVGPINTGTATVIVRCQWIIT